jgi:lysophospholipase L1-like esterase
LSLRLPQIPRTALRVAAALITVTLVILLGTIGTGEQPRPTYHHYVALGDSFTAAPFVPISDVARGCFRSSNNYPRQVASLLHIEDLKDRSCSGATTADLTVRQPTRYGMAVPPQLDALSERTDLVTVGIGANNHGLYARMATVCRRSNQICRLHDRRQLLGAIVEEVRPALVPALQLIRERAPRARVLLVGYPRLLPSRGGCNRLPRMRGQDRATFRDISLRLRYAMRDAARDTGVEFVDFYAVSSGHDICSRHPWVQGRQGNRRGAGMHPLASGQAALARTIEEVLRREPRTTPPST